MRSHVLVGSIAVLLFTSGPALGHAGPPIPLVSNRIVGPYKVSIWADPDSTDDGTAAGRFWITFGTPPPPGTRVQVAIRPLDRAGPTIEAPAQSEAKNASQWFSALVMDHEGRFQVRVTIDGPSVRQRSRPKWTRLTICGRRQVSSWSTWYRSSP